MTTSLRNVGFQGEITLFKNKKLPPKPITVVYALADCLLARGDDWIHSDEAKALLHTLSMCVHGVDYKINGTQQQKELERIFPKVP
jgi:hypothetical protein